MTTRLKDGIVQLKTLMNLKTDVVNLESSNYKQASKDSRWQQAMRDEYTTLIKNDTWELVPRKNN